MDLSQESDTVVSVLSVHTIVCCAGRKCHGCLSPDSDPYNQDSSNLVSDIVLAYVTNEEQGCRALQI